MYMIISARKPFASAIILLTSLFYSYNGFGQQAGLGSWNIFNVKYNYNKKLSFFGEGQIRSLKFYNQFHYYEYKAGFMYQFHKSATIALGAGNYDTYAEGGNFKRPKNSDEFRLWPQLIINQSLWQLKIEQRYRSEFRFTSRGFRMRYRYRVGAAYPFGKSTKGYKPYQIAFNNELFFTGREPYFERNRLALLFSRKITAQTTLQLGYLHQFDYRINDETGRDFLVVGLFLEFSRPKEK